MVITVQHILIKNIQQKTHLAVFIYGIPIMHMQQERKTKPQADNRIVQVR